MYLLQCLHVKTMRYPQQSSGPVTRVVVCTAGSAMRHPEVTRSVVQLTNHICPPPAELLRADQHIVRGPAVNVHDEAHAARVPLQRGVVQTCRERALFVIRSWVITAQLLSGHHPVGAKLSRVFCPIAASVSLLLVMSGSTSPSSSQITCFIDLLNCSHLQQLAESNLYRHTASSYSISMLDFNLILFILCII